MSKNDILELIDDSLNEDLSEEDMDNDSDEESGDTSDLVDKLRKENGILRRKLTKKEKKETPIKNTNPSIENEIAELRKVQEKLTIQTKYGYSDEQADRVLKFGGLKALEDEDIKSLIDSIGDKNKTKEAISIDGVTSKATGERATKAQIDAMSADEYQKFMGL